MRTAAPVYQRSPEHLARLDRIIAAMERAADHLEWMDISRSDLEFHREICRTSGNTIVQTLWEALARHVLIVFGKEVRDERDARALPPQHRVLRDLLAAGNIQALDSEVEQHILRLRRRKRAAG